MTTNTTISIDAGDVKLSGRYRAAVSGQPRALIVALPGGTYTSKYFDSSPETSLLDFGSSLGYSILALDRPGYGATASLPQEYITFDSQVSILHRTIETAWDKYGRGSAGVFILGHSIGGMLALMLCAKKQGSLYLGMEMTGSGAVFRAEALAGFREVIASGVSVMDIPPEARPQLFMGPKWTYQEVIDSYDAERDAHCPVTELHGALAWEESLPRVAATVKVPVLFVVPEFDAIWRSDPEALDHVAGMFTSSPFVDVVVQRHSGHCVELHTAARAYYMKTFAFLEECILQRSHP